MAFSFIRPETLFLSFTILCHHLEQCLAPSLWGRNYIVFLLHSQDNPHSSFIHYEVTLPSLSYNSTFYMRPSSIKRTPSVGLGGEWWEVVTKKRKIRYIGECGGEGIWFLWGSCNKLLESRTYCPGCQGRSSELPRAVQCCGWTVSCLLCSRLCSI